MKTLSNDITLQVETTGIPEGYVSTKIYADGIGVFSGQAYIPGDNSSLAININDIASQNRGKYDYLKLTDDGVVTTTPLIDDIYGTISYQYRFKRGQISRYGVQITKDSSNYSKYEDVLTGYDYPNKDLKPQYMDPSISNLCRIMQGCDWVYDHDEEIGNFQNLLLPHYPYIATNKYGMGLQLWTTGQPNINRAYELECELGGDVSLGSLIYVSSNSTFISLNDLITGFNMGDIDNDTSIYLKLHGVSGDEFGDYDEGYTYYPGDVMIDHLIKTTYVKNEDRSSVQRIDRTSPNFKNELSRYIANANAQLEIPQAFNTLSQWSAEAITEDPSTSVYHTHTFISESYTQENLDEFISYYTDVIVEETLRYRFTVEPYFATATSTIEVPTRYYGSCPVAIFDKCYSRYYLAWMDRYGDVQSQAFDGKIEYSENIENIEMQDYKLRRRPIQKLIQPKWKLNTKWLSEYIYPMYEAMFTSPYLLLYDTQTDRSWNVILTDTNYKEKTYKTEKGLFNLEITLEANKKQNYIF